MIAAAIVVSRLLCIAELNDASRERRRRRNVCVCHILCVANLPVENVLGSTYGQFKKHQSWQDINAIRKKNSTATWRAMAAEYSNVC